MGKTVIGNDEAMAAIMAGHNVFVSGPGGSGKSLMIATLRDWFAETHVFMAPTGIAALNIQGMTAHKGFGLTFGITTNEDYKAKGKAAAILLASQALCAIVIDEISMIRSDKLWEMDMKLRHHRKVNKPFGGLQVIVFGDGFQIKPVLKQQEEVQFREMHGNELPFDSKTWKELDFVNAYLPKVYRQADPEFAKHLNNIRIGEHIAAAVDYFNTHCFAPPLKTAVTLTTTNKLADQINQREYAKINAEEHLSQGIIQGVFEERPVDEAMKLKVGLKVMITVNDNDKRKEAPEFVNGTVGIITRIMGHIVVVNIDGKAVPITKNIWKNVQQVPEEKVVEKLVDRTSEDGTIVKVKEMVKSTVLVDKEMGSYTQFPFKMGYAITGHKSQGLTLGEVNIDLGFGAFTAGQTYVMLSRAKSIEGLRLMKKLRVKDVIVDQFVVNFYRKTFPTIFGGC